METSRCLLGLLQGVKDGANKADQEGVGAHRVLRISEEDGLVCCSWLSARTHHLTANLGHGSRRSSGGRDFSQITSSGGELVSQDIVEKKPTTGGQCTILMGGKQDAQPWEHPPPPPPNSNSAPGGWGPGTEV